MDELNETTFTELPHPHVQYMPQTCRDFTNEINPSINVYIYGGSVAQPGEFPHMVGRPAPTVSAASWDFAEPFDDGLPEGPLFRELVHRGPPLSRQPPPGAPPPMPLGADLDDPDATTPSDGLTDRAALQKGDDGDPGNVEVGGRTGFIVGGIRGAIKRHRERVERVKDGLRDLQEHLVPPFLRPGRRPGPEQGPDGGSTRPHQDDSERLDHAGADNRPYNPQNYPEHDNRPHNQPHRPDRPRGPDQNVPPQNQPLNDYRPPRRPDTVPRPPPSTAPPAQDVPDDDAYGSLIDPRAGTGGKSSFGAEFGALEEETTSRPRLIRVTGPSVGEGKAGRPGNWRVPPDSVWARPTEGPPGAPPGAPPGGSLAADAPAGSQAEQEGKAGGIALYVIGGDEALSDEFKHMVALGFRDGNGAMTWDCGGTLISNDHVLTAAHCVTNSFRGPPTRVRVGAHNLTEVDGEEHDVVQVTVHPQYSTQSHYNDLAVLRIGRGDSGGPLQTLDRPMGLYSIVGITSFGQLCGGVGVYIRVSAYVDWIESVIKRCDDFRIENCVEAVERDRDNEERELRRAETRWNSWRHCRVGAEAGAGSTGCLRPHYPMQPST
ncbi:hypothetical protein FOCC_FOCC000953 [Frankliniella occidentalis]|nr:hypothetical protein FOCC_FOCC000953 [Frankliniella occidentalis]